MSPLPSGSWLLPDYFSGHILELSPLAQVSTVFSSLVKPTLAVPDPSGSIWVTDTAQGKLHRIAPDGSLSVILPDLGWSYAAVWDDSLGELIVGIYGDGTAATFDDDPLIAVAPDGSTRTLVSTGVGNPAGIAMRANGDYVISDFGTPERFGRLLQVSPAGEIIELANGETSGQLWRPTGLQEVGEAIYFGDYGPAANQGLIQKYKAQEGVSVVAQVPGNPFGMVIENGEIVISDLWNQRILKLGDVPGLGEAPSELGEGVQILTEIDGMPLTVGESVTLQAQARDPQGQDITAQIQWTDQTGKVLGTGRNLTYTATETQMLTITANVGEKWDRVSTTISPSDVTVAPHVKVLSDQVADRVKLVDPEAGIIRLADEELSYPTIRESDVVIGAEGLVPPMKVTGITREGGDLVLSVVSALPKEVIEYGSATFEQTIDWSSENGPITIVEIPAESYHIADDLEPKWDGFVQGGDPISNSLTVTASTNRVWQPTYSGMIEFDKEQGDGIKELRLAHTSDISLAFTIDMRGTYEWGNSDLPQDPIRLPVQIKVIQTHVGPVPLLIELESTETLDLTAMAMNINSQANFILEGDGNYSEMISYEAADESPWMYEFQANDSQLNGSTDSNTSLEGILGTDYANVVSVKIFDGIETTSHLVMYGNIDGRRSINSDLDLTTPSTNGAFYNNIAGEETIKIKGGLVSWLSYYENDIYETTEIFESVSLQEEGKPTVSLSDLACEPEGNGFLFQFTLTGGEGRNICAYILNIYDEKTKSKFPKDFICYQDESINPDVMDHDYNSANGSARSGFDLCSRIRFSGDDPSRGDFLSESYNNVLTCEAQIDCPAGTSTCVEPIEVFYAFKSNENSPKGGQTNFNNPTPPRECVPCGQAPLPPSPPTCNRPDPVVDRNHILRGGINSAGFPTGYHHRHKGIDSPGRRLVPGTLVPGRRGNTYASQVEFQDSSGNWILKTFQDGSGNPVSNSFFPDDLDPDAVIEDILSAWRKWCPSGPGDENFTGDNGYWIRIRYNGSTITEAFPIISR